MSVIATALKHLIAAGVAGDDLVRAVAEMEAATDTRSSAARRQARYRERGAAGSDSAPDTPPRTLRTAAPDTPRRASRTVTFVTRDGAVPPNEYISNPPEPLDAKASLPPLAIRIVDEWNATAGKRGAKPAKPLDAGRRKALSLRIREHGEAAVFDAVRNLAASEFHCGRNDRGWRVDIGWMLRSPENFAKALELDSAPVAATPVSMEDYRATVARLEARGVRLTDHGGAVRGEAREAAGVLNLNSPGDPPRDAPRDTARDPGRDPPRETARHAQRTTASPPRSFGQLAAGLTGASPARPPARALA